MELLISSIIAAPYIVWLVWVLMDCPTGAPKEPQFRDIPPQENAAAFVHTSDKLAKIERAQRF